MRYQEKVFQMWRIASLFGIAAKLGREPYFELDDECMLESAREFQEIFPNLFKRLQFYVSSLASEKVISALLN